MADAGVMCFKSERERDCDIYGPDYVCRDNNGDGIIDGRDGGMGCERRIVERSAPRTDRVGDGFEVDDLEVDEGPGVVVVDGAHLYSTKTLDVEPSDMDHEHFAELRDCSNNPWHESNTMQHACTNSVYDYPEEWTTYDSGEECCDTHFHNAECHTVDVCEELLLGGGIVGDAVHIPEMSSTIIPQQVLTGGSDNEDLYTGGWDTHTFATLSVMEELAAEEYANPNPSGGGGSNPHNFEVFPGAKTAGGGHGSPLEDCSSVPWHVTDDMASCTNSGDYPKGWESMEGYLFNTGKDCCVRNFANEDCQLIDVCEDYSANMSDIVTMSESTLSSFEGSTTTEATTATSLVETLDQCLSRPWHVTHDNGSCTNSGDHPADWTEEDLKGITFYQTSMSCCSAHFQNVDYCHVVDVCDEMFPSEAQESSKVNLPLDRDITLMSASVPVIKSTMTALETTVSTNEAIAEEEEEASDFPSGENTDVEEFTFTLIEDDILTADITSLPWDYGSPPMWQIDHNETMYIGADTPTITNIPQSSPGATADLTLRIHVDSWATIRCHSKIKTSMPWDVFVFLVDGEVRYNQYYPDESTITQPLMTGIESGDHTIVFRVENSNFDHGMDREKYGNTYGSGRVWLDHCDIRLHN
jgi:hypothetical protein